MEILDSVVSLAKTLVLGFAALVGGLFIVAILFGKRIEKKWEYEAKFRGPGGKELGEFDIQLSRVIEKDPAEQKDFAIDAKFVLAHPSLQAGASVVVTLNEVRVFESVVAKRGRIRLNEDDLVAAIKAPEAGQIVSVEVGGAEIFSEALYED